MILPVGIRSEASSQLVDVGHFIRHGAQAELSDRCTFASTGDTFIFDHAGGPFKVWWPRHCSRDALVSAYGADAIQADNAPDDERYVVKVDSAPATLFKDIRLKGELYNLSLSPRNDHIIVAGPHFYGHISSHERVAHLLISEKADSYMISAFANMLRVVMAFEVLHADGIVLHACAYVGAREQAHLFFGRSTDGKSTLGHRVHGAGGDVLSDDYCCVTYENGLYWVEGVPLSGELGHTIRPRHRFRLSTIGTLTKNATLDLSPLNSLGAQLKMFAATPFVVADPTHHDLLMKRCGEMTSRLKPVNLSFGLTDSGEAIRHVIEEV